MQLLIFNHIGNFEVMKLYRGNQDGRYLDYRKPSRIRVRRLPLIT